MVFIKLYKKMRRVHAQIRRSRLFVENFVQMTFGTNAIVLKQCFGQITLFN